jgi:hypothetical protein
MTGIIEIENHNVRSSLLISIWDIKEGVGARLSDAAGIAKYGRKWLKAS